MSVMLRRSIFIRLTSILLVLTVLVCGAVLAQVQETAPKKSPNAVVIDGQELFDIQAPMGPYSPAQRANNIQKRLERLVTDPDFKPESIEIVSSETGVDIVAGDLIVMTVSETDAKNSGLSRHELAERYCRVLVAAMTEYQAKRSLEGALEDASLNNFMKTLRHLLLEPMILKVITLAVGILVISFIVGISQRSLGRYVKDSSRRYAARKVVTLAGYLLAFLLAIVVFRDALGNLAVIVGATTAAVAFALREVIVSLAGWVGINFGDFYKVGDRIQLGGVKGDVIDIGFARTTLMELGEWVNGDLYSGRIVRVANSFIFSQPLYNYSGDFPFVWDEIVVPVKYGSDHRLADKILKSVAADVSSEYTEEARSHWAGIAKKFLVENARTEPMVTLVLNDNWIEFTIRYVVEIKRRRLTKDALFRKILDEIEASEGKVQLASATFHLVEIPPLNVKMQS